jgi:pyrroloquinoline-quinone synthase
MLMARRIEAWKHHYPWVSSDALGYFQMRIARASLDSKQAVQFVVQHALTHELQERCVRALIRKTEILWHLLDCLSMAYVEPGSGGKKAAYDQPHDRRQSQTSA